VCTEPSRAFPTSVSAAAGTAAAATAATASPAAATDAATSAAIAAAATVAATINAAAKRKELSDANNDAPWHSEYQKTEDAHNKNFHKDNIANVTARDAVLERESFGMLIKCATAATKGLQADASAFSIGELSAALLRGGGVRKWRDADARVFDFAALGREAAVYLPPLPRFSFLFGPVDKVAAERRAPQRRRKVESSGGEAARPTEIGADGEGGEEKGDVATQRQTARIAEQQKALKAIAAGSGPEAKKGKSFFEFVVQPESFTETVENIFDLSFLVKKGSAALHVSSDGDLLVKHSELKKKGGAAAGGSAAAAPEGEVEEVDPTAKQCVLSFTMKDWNEVREAYEIEQGVLAKRGEEELMQKKKKQEDQQRRKRAREAEDDEAEEEEAEEEDDEDDDEEDEEAEDERPRKKGKKSKGKARRR